MKRENMLLEGPIGPALLRFALPFLAASFLQALYGAADLYVVGRFSGSEAVSAVAIGSQIMQTITGIILGLSTGGTVLIGRRIGERDERGAATAVGTLAVLLVILAVLLTPIMALGTKGIVAVMQTPTEAVLPTQQYLLLCACGIPFIIGYNAISGVFQRGGGHGGAEFRRGAATARLENTVVRYWMLPGVRRGGLLVCAGLSGGAPADL